MPVLRVLHPNVSGPPGRLAISCDIIEEPNSNFTPPMGTCQSAESVSRLVLNSSHQWSDTGLGVMSADREAIRSTEDYGPGLIAYRVSWTLQEAAISIPRVAAPAVAVATGEVMLTCVTAGAQILL